MTDPQLSQLHQQIGGVQSSLIAIQAAFEKADMRSEGSRRLVYKKLDDIGTDIHGIKMTVADNRRRIEGMEADVEDWRKVKQRGVGIFLLLCAGFTGLAALGQAIVDYLSAG